MALGSIAGSCEFADCDRDGLRHPVSSRNVAVAPSRRAGGGASRATAEPADITGRGQRGRTTGRSTHASAVRQGTTDELQAQPPACARSPAAHSLRVHSEADTSSEGSSRGDPGSRNGQGSRWLCCLPRTTLHEAACSVCEFVNSGRNCALVELADAAVAAAAALALCTASQPSAASTRRWPPRHARWWKRTARMDHLRADASTRTRTRCSHRKGARLPLRPLSPPRPLLHSRCLFLPRLIVGIQAVRSAVAV